MIATSMRYLSAAAIACCLAFPGPAGRAAGASCVPKLRPAVVVSGQFPTAVGTRAGTDWVTTDAAGEVLWSAQGPPPSHARLFLFHPATSRVTILHSPHADGMERIGLLAISRRWIAFADAADQNGGGLWAIVVRDRRTGRERVIARGQPGGLLSGQFGLDGDILSWVQPLDASIQVRAENLVTGVVHVLATVPAKDNVYDWLTAGGGHIAWEWNHLVGSKPMSDVLVASTSTRTVVHVTTNGQGSQPSMSWPLVTYLDSYHFARPRHVVVRNLANGRTWMVPAGSDTDYPRIGGSLLIYRPGLPTGLLALSDFGGSRQAVLKRDNQMVLDKAYLGLFSVRSGMLVALGTRMGAANGHSTGLGYVLAIFRFRDSQPLAGVVQCNRGGE